MKTEDIAWMAGFFEGEGTIYVTGGNNPHGTPYPRLKASIAQNDKRPLEKIKELLGYGTLNGPYRVKLSTTGHYQLSFGDKQTLRFIELLRPYLMAKGEQADRAIEEWRTRRAARVYKKKRSLEDLCL